MNLLMWIVITDVELVFKNNFNYKKLAKCLYYHLLGVYKHYSNFKMMYNTLVINQLFYNILVIFY